MEVPKNFATRLTAIADSTPRPTLIGLLHMLAPRVPVQTRAPSEWSPQERKLVPLTDPFTQKTKRKSVIKRKAGAAVKYEVLVPNASHNHRRGTWTEAMVYCIVKNTDTGAAADMLRARWPEYADRQFDLLWLSKVGYIRIN